MTGKGEENHDIASGEGVARGILCVLCSHARGRGRWEEVMQYYDREGKPIKLGDHLIFFQDPIYKQVASTYLPNGRHVSTVWLGLDHGFGNGPPLIFETMVFPEAEICERYSTEVEAREGHARLVQQQNGEK